MQPKPMNVKNARKNLLKNMTLGKFVALEKTHLDKLRFSRMKFELLVKIFKIFVILSV